MRKTDNLNNLTDGGKYKHIKLQNEVNILKELVNIEKFIRSSVKYL
jgi:hypothetical protein